MFNNIYKNKKILVTGHFGFKGSWLCLWLSKLGSDVCGISLKNDNKFNHFDLLNLNNVKSYLCDIRNFKEIDRIFQEFQPEVVFHLAAHALVIESYKNPVDTFTSNLNGTINVFEACRKCRSVKSIVAISSDKCYENIEQIYGYRETDPMGGYDPYSASKGCMELLINCYRNSFFKDNDILIASGRAGNVIGGGDWSKYRIIPDLIKSVVNDENLEIRSPFAIRPWQHVLEPITGYLVLGQKLIERRKEFAEGWNFGPSDDNTLTVKEIIDLAIRHWPEIKDNLSFGNAEWHEANLLRLDCTKSKMKLKFKNILSIDKTIEMTVNWYYNFYNKNVIDSFKNLSEYIEIAKTNNMEWLN